MEDHVVPLEAASAMKRKRRSDYTSEQISKAVTDARYHGAKVAAEKSNAGKPVAEHIPEETVRKWLSRWKKEGSFWEEQKKRGRKNLSETLPDSVQKEWMKQVESVRQQGDAVTGRVAAALGRGVLSALAPSRLERHGGDLKLCVRTGQRMLSREDMSYRKRSSKRIMPPDADLRVTRDDFYDEIAENFSDGPPPPELVLNFDQTFHLYDPTHGFTWEKRGSPRVQLKENRDGFTLVPVVSMTNVIGAQMIFGGTTAAVLPGVRPGDKLIYNYNSTHWSNESTTIQLWEKVIAPYIAKQREHFGESTPALVLADDFAAHWTPAVQKLVETLPNVFYVCIPDKLTHVFQPLDLGIIAAWKQSILRRKYDFIEAEAHAAVREGRQVRLTTSRPVLRDRVTTWIKELVADEYICAERCCRSGFVRAGINRVLYGDADGIDIDKLVQPSEIDYSVFDCQECGERGRLYTELPECDHFVNKKRAILCAGCFTNHSQLCGPVV